MFLTTICFQKIYNSSKQTAEPVSTPALRGKCCPVLNLSMHRDSWLSFKNMIFLCFWIACLWPLLLILVKRNINYLQFLNAMRGQGFLSTVTFRQSIWFLRILLLIVCCVFEAVFRCSLNVKLVKILFWHV